MKKRSYFIQQVILIMCASLLGVLLMMVQAVKLQPADQRLRFSGRKQNPPVCYRFANPFNL